MKKIFLTIMAAAILVSGYAQSDKYITAMKPLVASVDTMRTKEGLIALSNSFERIANAEKTQWLPYYYAAYCKIQEGMKNFDGQFDDKTAIIDPIADKAEEWLNQAEALEKDNSEIYCLRKMLSTLRLIANPMARYMEFGKKGSEQLAMAKKLDPENPRVYLLEGIDKINTPEQFGGSKERGKELLDTAVKKFGTFTLKTPISPNWGLPMAQYFLGMLNAK